MAMTASTENPIADRAIFIRDVVRSLRKGSWYELNGYPGDYWDLVDDSFVDQIPKFVSLLKDKHYSVQYFAIDSLERISGAINCGFDEICRFAESHRDSTQRFYVVKMLYGVSPDHVPAACDLLGTFILDWRSWVGLQWKSYLCLRRLMGGFLPATRYILGRVWRGLKKRVEGIIFVEVDDEPK